MTYILTDQDKKVLAITSQTSLSYSKANIVLEMLQECDFCSFDQLDVSLLKRHLSKDEHNELMSIDYKLLDNFINNLTEQGISVITLLSSIYPDNLKEISNPPLVLYAKGDLELLKYKNTLSVVGTRRCTNYGEEATKSIVRPVAREGIIIISGLADGIDTIAHEATLSVGGKTIAVMGSGFNHIYPSVNRRLVDKIVESGGLVLTEYEPNVPAQTFHFPMRNRIVAGLSLGVLIVEAPKRSGALITKEYALECNREIFVVPGRINDIYFTGSNEVIKNCQGTMVLSCNDVLDFYGKVVSKKDTKPAVQLSMEEQIVLDILKVNDKHYEELLIESKLSSAVINPLLIKLELKSLIKKLPGNIYTSTKI